MERRGDESFMEGRVLPCVRLKWNGQHEQHLSNKGRACIYVIRMEKQHGHWVCARVYSSLFLLKKNPH